MKNKDGDSYCPATSLMRTFQAIGTYTAGVHGFDPWLENYDLTGHTEQPKKSIDETVVVTYN